MRLLDRLRGVEEQRYSMTDYAAWINDINYPWNLGQLVQTWGQTDSKLGPPAMDYMGNGLRLQSSGPVFALMAVRLRLFSQIRWAYQQVNRGKPGDLFSLPSLDLVNVANLNTAMIRDVDLAGNFFGARINGDGPIWRLRPDWVQVMFNDPTGVDIVPVLYLYYPGGPNIAATEDIIPFQPDEILHWWPEPDPANPWRGMSWLTSVARELQADLQATEFKNKFYENGATPNMVVKFDKETSFEAFEKFADRFRLEHEGVANAYKTLFLGGGADTTVVGADFKQIDFKAVQGATETRLAAAAGVHPVVAGFSEGMQGASLNSGNFAVARRSTADVLLHPLWTSAAGAIGKLLAPPPGARMWYDARNVPFLREDAKDDAEIKARDSATIRQLVDAGYEPDSVIKAVMAGDWSLLSHTGLFSVQLQPPMTSQPAMGTSGRSLDMKILRDENEFIQGAQWIEVG